MIDDERTIVLNGDAFIALNREFVQLVCNESGGDTVPEIIRQHVVGSGNIIIGGNVVIIQSGVEYPE